MRQRTLGILGVVFLVAGVALGVVSGIVAHSSLGRNAMPEAGAVPGHHRFAGPLQGGQRPGSFFGGPGGPDFPRSAPNGPGREEQPPIYPKPSPPG